MERTSSFIEGRHPSGMQKHRVFLLMLFLILGLCGCQTSAVQEELPVSEVSTEDFGSASAEPEEEYIDADYIDAHFGENAEDFGAYSDTRQDAASDAAGVSGEEGLGRAAGSERSVYGESGWASGGSLEGGQDEYGTDPVPEGEEEPVEPEDASVDYDTAYTCTLYVECSTILNNWEDLKEEKQGLVPSNGVIFGPSKVSFYKGESVYDILQREMKDARIHMESTFTPGYNSAYVEGINNLYEFDCGGNSGWMYCVNGWYPNYGCSRYQVSDGDRIEWHYTCDLGRDLGR